jgi:hypothetical protein
MKHIVIEAGQVFEWDGGSREWQPIPMSLASSDEYGGGKTWVWPDRAMARANGFIPPSAVERSARQQAAKPLVAIVFEKEPSVVVPGMERVIAYQWDGSEWKPILAATAHAMVGRGEAYRWPDRVTAEFHGFIPPPFVVVEPPAEVAGGWVAVADRLPTERRVCMVTDGEEIVCRVWIPGLKEWMEMESAEYLAIEDDEITHWWPCPAVPR